jgi:hypothetical protein
MGGLGGPHSLLGRFGEWRNVSGLSEIEPRFFGYPVRGLLTIPTERSRLLALSTHFSQVISFRQVSQAKLCIRFSSLLSMLIGIATRSLICSVDTPQYLVTTTNHEVSQCPSSCFFITSPNVFLRDLISVFLYGDSPISHRTELQEKLPIGLSQSLLFQISDGETKILNRMLPAPPISPLVIPLLYRLK